MAIEAQNGHVFFKEIPVKRELAGMEMIAAADVDKRYKMGEVVSAAEGVPLEPGDKFLYSWNESFYVYADNDMHQVVNFRQVIGKVHE